MRRRHRFRAKVSAGPSPLVNAQLIGAVTRRISLLCISPPCPDSARVLPPEKRIFRFGERDRPGRPIRRPAEWPGEASGRPSQAPPCDDKPLWTKAKRNQREPRDLQDGTSKRPKRVTRRSPSTHQSARAISPPLSLSL